MEAKVTWKGRMSFTGSADSGFEIPLGTSPDVGGDNDGSRPMELMALSLAGCTAMDVISILQKKRLDVTHFEVHVDAGRSNEHPKVFNQATIVYRITGHAVQEEAVRRAIELSATRYCPAQAMLGKVFPIQLTYQIFEDQGEGKPVLVKSGRWEAPVT